MGATRLPAAAGSFYPENPSVLREMVTRMLREAKHDALPPKAIIAPHAGYVYSGPIAASAYALLEPVRHTIKRVVLLGPAQHVRVHGVAISGADSFTTPLGRVRVDHDAVREALTVPGVYIDDEAHEPEHSIEVHLPFLQTALDDFAFVPMLHGLIKPDMLQQVLLKLWGGPETLICISSDLSHYLSSDKARNLDELTSRSIEGRRPNELTQNQACGLEGIRGLLGVAIQRNMTISTLDLRNSGDTAGPRDHVVGYGAWALYDPQ